MITSPKSIDRRRRRGWQVYNLLAALALLLTALGGTTISASAGNQELKADPRLLQMATENPDAVFMVIIQKDAKNNDLKDMEVEDEILKGGGQVKNQLDMITSFSAELTGKEILKLARHPRVVWISADAPMVSTASPGMETMADDFTALSYTGNTGTASWTTNWAEWGDNSPTSGMIQVVNSFACSGGSGNCLRLDPSSPTGLYIYREANLSGFVSVWLSFYRNNQLFVNSGGTYEQVHLQISSDGGWSWTTLRSYTGRSYTGASQESFDISAYASANTRIRFLISSYQFGTRYIYFDDITITYARPSVYLPTVRADQMSLNGQGITVAVVDSGIAQHNDFMQTDNTSRVIYDNWFGNQGSSADLNGHGTFVAGILGGNGAASNGMYRGIAPGVNLVNLRVADKDGMTYESSLIDSLQWVYNNRAAYNIRVVNISMNSTVAQSYHTSPLDAAVEILWFNGIVVVVSAGNNGSGSGPVTIYPPANDPFVITVGASEDEGTPSLADDHLAVFSAYGTTEDGFAKPDLVAPGRNIVAALSDKTSTVYVDHPLHRVGDYYYRMSGTSMSAPMVSGAVALLLQDEPNLNPDQVKYRLTATAGRTTWAFDPNQAGGGCLDVYAAVNGTTTSSSNQGIVPSRMLASGTEAVNFTSVGWNSVGWNSVGWNSVGWNSVGWNSVGWNSVGWNSVGWNSVGWNSVGWNSSIWAP